MERLTKAEQLMVTDGCPIRLFISQEDRNKFWLDNPPSKSYTPSFPRKEIVMTPSELALLFSLRDSKKRGAASLGCSSHIAEVAVLERLGFAKQHGFGPTAFYISDAGVKELDKHKRVVDPYERDRGVVHAPPHPKEKESFRPDKPLGKSHTKAIIDGMPKPPKVAKPAAPRDGSKPPPASAVRVVEMMKRPGGVTKEEVLKELKWVAISFHQQAAFCGVELEINKSSKPWKYMVKP